VTTATVLRPGDHDLGEIFGIGRAARAAEGSEDASPMISEQAAPARSRRYRDVALVGAIAVALVSSAVGFGAVRRRLLDQA
jgi:hypothetical protein